MSVACARVCQKEQPKEDEPPTRTVTADGESTLEVLSEGREPLFRLEVGRWAGLRYEVELRGDASFGVVGQGMIKAPTNVVRSSYEVLKGAGDPVIVQRGGRPLRLVEERSVVEEAFAESTELPPDALAGLNTNLALLQGLVTRQLVAEDGEITSLRTELVGGKPPEPEVKELVDKILDVQRRFPFRLPPRPVGVTGKWRFKESVSLQGVRLWQVSEMTFVTMVKDRITIGLRVRHEAPRQSVPHPLDPMQSATVEQYRGDGNGELVMDRLTAVLLEGRLQTTGSLRISWLDEGEPKSATFVSASTTRIKGTLLDPEEERDAQAAEGGEDGAP